jgi:hypothetical protein
MPDKLKRLEEFSTEDLLDEVFERCHHAVFAAIKYEGEGFNYWFERKGMKVEVQGLLKDADRRITNEINQSEKPEFE